MRTKTPSQSNETPSGPAPLQGWKDIAAYLDRDARTARRWEQSSGLPVRRHGGERGSVYAYPAELDAWRSARQPRAAVDVQSPSRRGMIPLVAAVAALVAVAAVVLWGPIMKPPGPLAEAANAGGEVTLRRVWAGTDVDGMGSPSPDGRYLSFVHWDTGDLGLRDLVAGETRLLTNKGNWDENEEFAEFSVISPDGRQIVYAWFNEDSFYDLRVIGVKGVSGGELPRVLYSNPEMEYIVPAAWFPDGERVLAVFQRKDSTAQIGIVDTESRSVSVLKTVDWRWSGKTALSPDGRYVLYDFPDGGREAPRDIFLLATDGSREIPLVTHSANDEVLGWTPDGASVLFTSDRGGRSGAWLLPMADGKAQGEAYVVKSDMDVENPIGFSSDGSFFYNLRIGMGDIYKASLDVEGLKAAGAPERVTERFVGSNRSPAWSPDGKHLAYISRRGQTWGRPQTIVIRSVETGKERDLAVDVGYMLRLRWASDGQSLFFASRDKRGRPAIFRLYPHTGELSMVVSPEADTNYLGAEPTPDGKTLFYAATRPREKRTTIRARNLESGEERQIYQSKSWLPFELSPAADFLAIRELDRETRSVALLLLPAAGGAPRELMRVQFPEGIGSWPAWTPDGKRILVWKRQDLRSESKRIELWSVPIDGDSPRGPG